MSGVEALKAAQAAGVRILADGGDLILDAKVPPPASILEALRQHKSEVISLLRPASGSTAIGSLDADFEERAAIAEFDGGMPREWAEGLAQLDTMPCPPQVRPARWSRFIDDAANFADRWAAQAAALGWGPEDIWGCNGRKPVERLDHAGLVWLLDGRELVALTADIASIRTASGATQNYVRRRTDTGTDEIVLAWELEIS